jgi:hypothetical protein
VLSCNKIVFVMVIYACFSVAYIASSLDRKVVSEIGENFHNMRGGHNRVTCSNARLSKARGDIQLLIAVTCGFCLFKQPVPVGKQCEA